MNGPFIPTHIVSSKTDKTKRVVFGTPSTAKTAAENKAPRDTCANKLAKRQKPTRPPPAYPFPSSTMSKNKKQPGHKPQKNNPAKNKRRQKNSRQTSRGRPGYTPTKIKLSNNKFDPEPKMPATAVKRRDEKPATNGKRGFKSRRNPRFRLGFVKIYALSCNDRQYFRG